jgi:starvation-inducible DNA-binding protein
MIIDTLKTSLANHIEASLTVQGYHWNCEGIDFKQFHAFFAEIYSDFYDQVDTLAEYVRTLSESVEYVNPSMDVLQKNKTIKGELIVGNKTIDMCKAISKLNTALMEDYATIFDEATKENQQGLADWAAGRLDKVSRVNWMIVSITKD